MTETKSQLIGLIVDHGKIHSQNGKHAGKRGFAFHTQIQHHATRLKPYKTSYLLIFVKTISLDLLNKDFKQFCHISINLLSGQKRSMSIHLSLWSPYSCKGRRTCLQRCFKEDLKASTY